MAIQFNHTIVWSSNQSASAKFLAEMLGRPVPTRFGHFDVVELDNGVSLDFADAEGAIRPQHYAFLISEAEFDAVLERLIPLVQVTPICGARHANESLRGHSIW